MRKYPVFILLMLLTLASITEALGQNRETLQQNKRKLEEEIRVANELLARTTKDKKASIAQISILDSKIKSREALITNLSNEVGALTARINELNDSISYYNTALEQLREDYAKMVVHAWETKNLHHRLMFIFAAEDLNQAYRRMQYYDSYSKARRTQAAEIEKTNEDLERAKALVEREKQEQLGLIHRKETEKNALSGEKSAKSNAVTQLQKKEKDLRREIQKKQEAARQLEKEIERIIREEMAKANKGKASSSFQLTPEEALLSDDFAKNKGKLPWPSERGVMASSYGEHAHPVLKGVKVKNNGIDILTEQGAFARAIFKGTVTRIIKVPQFNNVVIIRHGEYLTVYSNLDKVFVTEGSTVDARSSIGTVFTDPGTGDTQLHLEIWKGSTLQNPQSWLAK